MNICMYMNIIYTHSMVTYVTAIIILLAWVTVACKKDMGVTTRLLAMYIHVGLNAGTVSLHGLSSHTSSDPRMLSKAESVILGSREL